MVAPGRELAVQIDRVAGRHFPDVSSTAVVGGANRKRQAEALQKAKPALVVGTPGRLAELAFEGSRPLKLGKLRWCVVDECDHALRPPFGEDVEALLGALPRSCGVVLASATGAALLGDEGGGQQAGPGRAARRRDGGGARGRRVALAARARTGASAAFGLAKSRVVQARGRGAGLRDAALVPSRTRRPPRPSRRVSRPRASTRAARRRRALGERRAAVVRHLNEGAAPARRPSRPRAARGLDCPRVTRVVNYLSAPSRRRTTRTARAARAARPPRARLRPLGRGAAAQDRVPRRRAPWA